MLKTESILGKQQNIVGSSDKDIVLQTKGKVKIQQGSKFIDLILNGKLNFPDIINKVNTINDIGKSLGFYYVINENAIYALIDGKLIPLGDGTYTNSENGVNKLSELEDVLLINVRDGDLLVYNGGYWVNSLYNLKDLEDLVNKVEGIESDLKDESNYTQRTFQDVMETFEMMFDPEGDYFTDKIKPLAVHTAQLIVGTNSQQFSLENIKFEPNFLGDCNRFGANVFDTSKPGLLIHNTIGLENNAGYTWEVLKDTSGSSLTVPDWEVKNLDPNKPYYLYAKCSKRNNQGEFILTTEQILLEAERDFYHFWVGVLNTPRASLNETNSTLNASTVEASKVRSFQTMYGFTEIAGNTITTGVIKDQLGYCYWDMINGNMRIGDPGGNYIHFNSDSGVLKIKGYIEQTDPDNPSYTFIGDWVYGTSIKYKKNSIVKYKDNLYLCLKDVYGNIYPDQNTEYWKLLVSGSGYEIIYKLNNSEQTPTTPIGDNPEGWSTTITQPTESNRFLWMSSRIKNFSTGKWEEWSVPVIYIKYTTSPFKIDLTNEMASIACNNDMTIYNTISSFTLTYVNAYMGLEKMELTEINVKNPIPNTFHIATDIKTGGILLAADKGEKIEKVNTFVINIKASYYGEIYSGSVNFTVNGVPGGADALLYRIIPSHSVIRKLENNTLEPASISCNRLKNNKETTEGTLQYSINNGNWVTISNNQSIPTTSITSNIRFQLLIDNVVVDKESIPLIKDGNSPFKVDLTNESDSIACNDDMTVFATSTITTTVNAYMGTSKLTINSITHNANTSKFTVTTSTYTGAISVKANAGTLISKNNTITFTIKANFGGTTYTGTVTLSIAGIPGGKNAILYRVIPSVTAVKRTNTKENTPSSVSCSRTKTVGGTTSNTTDGVLEYSIDNGYWYSYSNPISSDRADKSIGFRLKVNNQIVDTETVPIIQDGADGTNGIDGNNGSKGDDGLILVMCGTYDSNSDYCLNTETADVVYYNSSWYRRYNKTGCYSNILPTNTSYWKKMNSFESLATDVLLAKEATIGGWYFSKQNTDNSLNYIRSKGNQVCFSGEEASGRPLIAVGDGFSPNSNGNGGTINKSATLKIYQSGILTVGNGVEESNAGISGVGNSSDSVRFWAGTTYASNGSAPFRVTQEGELTATNCILTGDLTTKSSGAKIIIKAGGFSVQDSKNRNVLTIGTAILENLSTSIVGLYNRDGNGNIKNQITLQPTFLQIFKPKVNLGFKVTSDGVVQCDLNFFPTQNNINNGLYATGTLYCDTNDGNRIKMKRK